VREEESEMQKERKTTLTRKEMKEAKEERCSGVVHAVDACPFS
jgi:hypothetical protein